MADYLLNSDPVTFFLTLVVLGMVGLVVIGIIDHVLKKLKGRK